MTDIAYPKKGDEIGRFTLWALSMIIMVICATNHFAVSRPLQGDSSMQSSASPGNRNLSLEDPLLSGGYRWSDGFLWSNEPLWSDRCLLSDAAQENDPVTDHQSWLHGDGYLRQLS